MKEEEKDLNYWKENAIDAYMTTPICVLRYITELEKAVKNNSILQPFPTLEEIEIKYPCEVGQNVIMESDISYDDIIRANYYRRQGAKWIHNLLINNED